MAEQMRWEHIIQEDGKVITNVLERQEGTQCSKVRQFASTLGDEISDEQTGPECDDVHERIVG